MEGEENRGVERVRQKGCSLRDHPIKKIIYFYSFFEAVCTFV